MRRIATDAGLRAHAASVAMTLVLGAWAMNACAQARDSDQRPDPVPRALLPAEIHGFWDLAPDPCVIEPWIESDSRLEIGADFVRGYEERMEVREAEMVSDVPLAWRVLAVSDIAPPHLQGPALYVLSGDSLTIAYAEQAQSYVRCRAASAQRDES